MRILKKTAHLLLLPLQRQGAFIVTMYILGVVCSYLTLPDRPNAHVYAHLWAELALDVYVGAAVLTLLPKQWGLWMRRVAYGVLYAVAVVDVYCFWKFNSTLTPTMLMLVSETDSREAGEFLRSYLTPEVLTSPLFWIFLLMLLHALWALRARVWTLLPERRRLLLRMRWEKTAETCARPACRYGAAAAVAVVLITGAAASWQNKKGMAELMTASTIGQIEHILTRNEHGEMYLPVYRLAFSIYSNYLADRQLAICKQSAQKTTVDSCTYTSPTIVLIIGESYSKQHDAQYGYDKPTAPRQIEREHSGRLTPFQDVVSCWNLTSFVFKNFLSTHVIGQKGEWCDYPLFPQLFRKAGYNVTFLTNQFVSKSSEAVYDFSGGFFLNDPELSAMLFDYRNQNIHRYDEGLLHDYDSIRSLQKEKAKGQLVIFHLIGQHVRYHYRCPNDRRVFKESDYVESRPDLDKRRRMLVADYDNACLYNDSIVDAICRKFDRENAVIIYMSDHGEECYEPGRNIICRNHSAHVDWPLAHYEFEVPFWIYCTHSYAVSHPHIFKAIKDARGRRFMTDALPHLLLGLAGIHTRDYHPEYDLLAPEYDETRPRILKNSVDYDRLRDAWRDTHHHHKK